MTPDSKTKLTAELCQLVAMMAWVEPDDITPTTSLSGVNVDSLGRLELIAHVEAHLGVMLAEQDIPLLDTVTEIVEFAERAETELFGSPS